MEHGEHHVVIGTGQEVGYPVFHPLIFLGRTTERAVPVATAVVLCVGVHALMVIALVAMIAQGCGVAAVYLVGHWFGVGIFGLESTCGEQLLEACATVPLHGHC